MKFDKWFVYSLCAIGIGLHVRMLIRSIQNHEDLVMDIIGLFLWIAYLVVMHINIKKKEIASQERTDKSN
ncbi:hypothetical protein SAMN05661091_2328 [Paenibacillus uliginis N3/975]|uniref:Uncharacterized protein n=1 Tax=Paenibacillus uliginis N3/975 TaxID=1313296 RepID=A0A1X7HBP3_9BACL|nr:hypothetical protein SAMN05661091_2328 [Paenibacillus uliginis N3/975]